MEKGTFGYHFEEALWIRHHLAELSLGDLWLTLCDLDRYFGTNFRAALWLRSKRVQPSFEPNFDILISFGLDAK